MRNDLGRHLRGVDVAIGKHRDIYRCDNGSNCVVLCVPSEGTGTGSTMDCQGCNAGIFGNVSDGYAISSAGRGARANLKGNGHIYGINHRE